MDGIKLAIDGSKLVGGNNKSNQRPISCGVPQCSAFDPLLFILYINDLENCCLIGKIIIFVNDTALYFSCKDTREFLQLDKWFPANLLKLYTENSSYNCIFRITQNHFLNLPEEI